VQIRNDYNASQSFAVGPIPIGKTSNQQQFTQIDGRINRPLTVQLRLNGTLKDTRDGHIVPGVTLTAFHLPSTNNGTATGSCDQACDTDDTGVGTDFNSTSEHKLLELAWIGLGLKEFVQQLQNFNPTPIYASPVLPTAVQAGWIDVKLNADPSMDSFSLSGPNTTTPGAARTVDAVAGPFGAINTA